VPSTCAVIWILGSRPDGLLLRRSRRSYPGGSAVERPENRFELLADLRQLLRALGELLLEHRDS